MKSDLETAHFAFGLLVRFCGHSLPGAFVKALGRSSSVSGVPIRLQRFTNTECSKTMADMQHVACRSFCVDSENQGVEGLRAVTLSSEGSL